MLPSVGELETCAPRGAAHLDGGRIAGNAGLTWSFQGVSDEVLRSGRCSLSGPRRCSQRIRRPLGSGRAFTGGALAVQFIYERGVRVARSFCTTHPRGFDLSKVRMPVM